MDIGFKNPATRIVVAAVSMLAVTSLIVGAAVLPVMQARLTSAISGILTSTLENRSRLFVSLIDLRESQARVISTRPGLKHSARVFAAGTDVALETAAIETVLASFLEAGYTGLAYYDAGGREVARAGRFVETPEMAFQLNTPLRSELFWADGFSLRTRVSLSDVQGGLGSVLAEQPLPIITQLMRMGGKMGETGEEALCFAKKGGMRCFP